jgi:hypothetical protein
MSGPESHAAAGDAHGPKYAAGVIEARLGRAALDVLEAAVVLEAWGGLRASRALSLGSRVVPPKPPRWMPGRLTTEESGRRDSILTEAIALIMAIVAVASWAGPLSRQVGTTVLEHAILVALPLTLALQWAIRSRYLSRRAGLSWLSHDRVALGVFAVAGIEAPLILLHPYGPLAAMFVAIWVGGTVLARRGWALLYGLLLVGTVVGLELSWPAYPLLGALTAVVLLASIAAVRTAREPSNEPAGRVGRAAWAAAMGGALGGLLVGDSSLGWGVHGAFPALALLPSVLGSFWGGYHLWKLYDALPRGLQGVALARANARDFRGPAMSIFLGSMLRLIGTTVVLSGVVILIAQWTSGTNRLSLFVGFGCVALITLLVNLLESLAYIRWALFAALASVLTELSVSHLALSPVRVPGAALIVGATVGILIALPPLIRLLLHPGRVLATSLWIK